MAHFGSPISWSASLGSGTPGIFGQDQDNPYRRLQLAMAMSDMASGMQVPRMAGWSAPFGGAARGLAQMMPYVAQMQMDRYQQQRDQAQKAAVAQAMQQAVGALPQDANNPYLGLEKSFMGNPATIDLATQLLPRAIEWQPPKKNRDLQTVVKGAQEETGYFDEGGDWVKVGGGPRWQPQRPEQHETWQTLTDADAKMLGLPAGEKYQRSSRGEIKQVGGSAITLPQEAGNDEISAARRYLLDNNLSTDEIVRRTQEQTATGRDNADYDPYLAKTFNLAMQHKIGDDPGFDEMQKRYRAKGGAGTTTATALPRTSSGEIDANQLDKTTVYDDGAGGRWRWTGTDFVEAQ